MFTLKWFVKIISTSYFILVMIKLFATQMIFNFYWGLGKEYLIPTFSRDA